MLLTILDMRYLKAMAEYALLLLLLGAAVFGWATWITGVTLYLVPAPVLPIVESATRFKWPRWLTERKAVAVGLIAVFVHAVFLWLAQSGTAEMNRFTVICQYLSLVAAGTGLGCMLFTNQILNHRETKRSRTGSKGKGGFQRPRKVGVKKPMK
ncbi:MAG TPA: hypothetical protein PKV86_10500 [Syntrophobacteraceae bacterium]|nr:hypothetical protein [Syntrophobacteraceae bacterium]